ncbi:MAG: hypothetical protein KA715_07000 [Xanthomonadaceae bacterium]|nr:hypothetical protein [Xanthomonadaceae bacterium]
MRLRFLGKGLGVYLAIPTALALVGGLWFGLSLRETPEEQLLVERLDALAAQTQILSDSLMSEIDRIKIEVQSKSPLNSQIRYWSALKRQGNDLGGIQASSVLAPHTSPESLKILKEQQWELGKQIDVESIDRNGFQIFQFQNEDLGMAWSHGENVIVAWIKNFRSLNVEDRKTFLFHESRDSTPHWTLSQARKILFNDKQKLGVSYQVLSEGKAALSAFIRIEKTPWFIVTEQLDTSGIFHAPQPMETKLGQGLAAFGILLLFGGLAARGLERKTKTHTFTASEPPPFATISSYLENPTPIVVPFSIPKILTLEAGLLEPKVEAIASSEPPVSAVAAEVAAEEIAESLEAQEQVQEEVAEELPLLVEPVAIPPPFMGSGAVSAGPATFRIPAQPDYVDEDTGKQMLSELQAQILNLTDKKLILDRVANSVSKLCESPVLFFEYRKEFKAALLSTTAGFSASKTPKAMSFPIADEAVQTISTSTRNRKVASLANFQPLCRVIMDRTGVAYFDAWAVTSQNGHFHGVLVVLQAGVQSALHKPALTRLLSQISLSSEDASQEIANFRPYELNQRRIEL